MSSGLVQFELPFEATAADIDNLGHVSNIVYVRWLQELAIAHSQSLGWDFAQYEQVGGVWVVRRHEIDYGHPVQHGERVMATTWVDDMRAVACTRHSEFVTSHGKQALKAATTWVFINSATGRPMKIPAAIKALFVAEA